MKSYKSELRNTNLKINKMLQKVLKLKEYESKFKKINIENKELKKLDKILQEEFKRMQEETKQSKWFNFEEGNYSKGNNLDSKMDLDWIGITSDEFRSERHKKYVRGIDCKGHPLVPKLNFK